MDTARETALEAATGNPLGNGDPPWVNHWNRIQARIGNFGIVDASDVQATFYVNSPPAIGDRGTWVPLAVETVPAIAAGTSAVVQANWFPVRGEHTCIKVEIESQLGETEVKDNGAQENVSVFNTDGASPHEPIVLDVRLQNPLTSWAKLELAARGLPPGWELATENKWVWLPPLGREKGRAGTVHRPRTRPASDRQRLETRRHPARGHLFRGGRRIPMVRRRSNVDGRQNISPRLAGSSCGHTPADARYFGSRSIPISAASPPSVQWYRRELLDA